MTDIIWATDGSDAAVAEHLVQRLAGGNRIVAVPGGSTPASILQRLVAEPLDWPRITFTLTDDRQVPHEHPASNFGALQKALGQTGARLLPLEAGETPPRFDLVWLGMGLDGHIASIFPGIVIAPNDPPSVAAVTPHPLPAEAPFPRLTLNHAALAAADEIVLVVRGYGKRELIAQALAGEHNLPIAQFLASATGRVTIFWSPQ